MPSRTNTTTVAPTGAAAPKRFELPALDFKFGSLTDGTDIPPPLPSPIQEEAAPAPPNAEQKQQDGTGAANGAPNPASPNSQLSSISTGTKRPAEDGPASPTLSNRPGSIRRLFSRNLLNTAYANGDEAAPDGRPQSRGTSSVADSRKAKRSSGFWFGRLRGNETSPSNPAAPLSPPPTNDKKPTGPPPPKIPELSELKSKLGIQNDDSFGSDLFKDIK